MTDAILVLNAGSSSIKFALYECGDHQDQPLIVGRVGGIGRQPSFDARDRDANRFAPTQFQSMANDAGHAELTSGILNWLQAELPQYRLVAAGHRVVHGGLQFSGPVRIDPAVLQTLAALTPLAPLHQPNNLAAVEAIAERHTDLPQVACFDTSFHRTMPRLAQLFGLPRAMTDAGVVRYGFHGLSYEYIASVLPAWFGERATERIVVAHLGNGASMAALYQQQSVATTMGFTALHGLMMGRRSGTVDAGIVLHLLQQQGMTVDQVWTMLYRQSGLAGVSGISNSMQVLTDSDEPAAREAVDLFCYRAVCEIGSLAAALQGLDGLVFTAGIGENSATVREKICRQLGWLGVSLDNAANRPSGSTDSNGAKARLISTQDSRVPVAVIPTDEQLIIARSVRRIVFGAQT